MRTLLPLTVIIPYSIFSLFLFCQQLHMKHYRGASRLYPVIVSRTGLLGLLTGTIFLAFYAFKVAWWAPFAIVAIGFLFKMMVQPLIDHFAPWIGMAGIIGWPICAVLMFLYTPNPRHEPKVKGSISAFLETLQCSSHAATVINSGKAYSIVGNSDQLEISLAYADAVDAADRVNTKVLNKEYPGWGEHFEGEFRAGLKLALDGHLNGDSQKILAANELLSKWYFWYNANVDEIKWFDAKH